MKNFVQPGKTVDFVPSALVLSGQPVLLGPTLVGIANLTTQAGVPNEADVEGVFDLPKNAGLAISAFDKVYFNAAGGYFTKTNTDVPAGHAMLAALAGDATVRVRLEPGLPA